MSFATGLFADLQDKSQLLQDDFMKDGLKHCSICQSPRQCKIQVEGITFTMPTPCKCQSKALELKQKIIEAETNCSRIPDAGGEATKKNHQEIHYKNNHSFISQSKTYKSYEASCVPLIPGNCKKNIGSPVNVKAVYFMPSRRRVDITNLHSAKRR